MKREFLFIIVLLVLMSTNVFAKNVVGYKNMSEFGAIKGGLNDATENILERVIVFPESISGITKFIFGENITFENLIVLIGIWIAIFVIIKGTVSFIPVFEGKMIKIIGSIIVTTLMILSGIVPYIQLSYLNFLESLDFLEKLGPFKIFIELSIVGIIVYGISKISKIYNNALFKEKAGATGYNIKLLNILGKIRNKNI